MEYDWYLFVSSCRLFARATVMGFKRSMTNQYTHTSLLKVDGVQDRKSADFYMGKLRG
jgi:large subunit ribosomal protein L35Ae